MPPITPPKKPPVSGISRQTRDRLSVLWVSGLLRPAVNATQTNSVKIGIPTKEVSNRTDPFKPKKED